VRGVTSPERARAVSCLTLEESNACSCQFVRQDITTGVYACQGKNVSVGKLGHTHMPYMYALYVSLICMPSKEPGCWQTGSQRQSRV